MSTALHDVASSAFLAASLYPAGVSSSPTGSTIDMLTADGPCFAIQQVGSFSADDLTGRIEESPDGSSWSTVSGATFTEVTGANDVQVITFTRTARYLRYAATLNGSTPLVDLAALIGEQKKSL